MSGDNQNDDNMLMMNESSTILTLNDRFERLNKLFDTSTTTTTTSSSSTSTIIIDNKCYNYEFLLDLLIAVYTDIQRFVLVSNVCHFERFFSFRTFVISNVFSLSFFLPLFRNVKPTTRDKNSSSQKFTNLVKPLVDYIRQLQLNSNDFEQIKIIGKGAFGQVSLVKVIEFCF